MKPFGKFLEQNFIEMNRVMSFYVSAYAKDTHSSRDTRQLKAYENDAFTHPVHLTRDYVEDIVCSWHCVKSRWCRNNSYCCGVGRYPFIEDILAERIVLINVVNFEWSQIVVYQQFGIFSRLHLEFTWPSSNFVLVSSYRASSFFSPT